MKKLLFIIIDVLCFIGGSILFVYNAFDFFFSLWKTSFIYERVQYPKPKENLLNEIIPNVETAKILMLVGLALIIFGFLIRSWRKNNVFK